MSARRLGLALAAATTLVLAAAPAAPALNPPAPLCNGSACGGGWYRGTVTVTWSVDPSGLTSAPCGSTAVTNDTRGQTVSCTVQYGSVTVSNTVTVKKDASPPGVKAEIARGPDANGWYTSPVGVKFTGDDGVSGVASCTSGTYGGPDGAAVSVSGTCTDNAGNTGSTSLAIKYDATPPTATATPSRPPDANGWYNHAVTVTFSATDVSGTTCTAPAVYKGPDADPARVTGTCQDGAGHVSPDAVLELRYDHTPPAKPKVTISTGAAGVALGWKSSRDVARVEIVRAPGRRGAKSGVVFRGKGTRLVDRRVAAGTRYWYEIRVFDQAGNMASTTVHTGSPAAARTLPRPALLAPLDGARVHAPPLAAWKSVPGASFYNLQLWRGREKVLTLWPSAPRFQLASTWLFAGRRQRLLPGTYTIYVWPAFGTRADPRFGKLLGRVTFTVA